MMADPRPSIEEIEDCLKRKLIVDNRCVRWLLGEYKSLQTIVNGVEKTADGVSVTEDMEVFVGPAYDMPDLWPVGSAVRMCMCGGHDGEVLPRDCYSTKRAVDAAKAKKETG